MRTKTKFEGGWKFHKGELSVMHAVKSGMAGGFTDCAEIEQGEWLKIAYFDEREPSPQDMCGWEDIRIPHDWCVEGEYDEQDTVKNHKDHGYLKAGVGYYRKEFEIPENWKDKKVVLEFEGIFRNSTIWVNGHKLVHHESGYTGFACDMTDVLRYGTEGKNAILVKVDATDYEGWWYEGAGIYRHIWLVVTDRLHIKRHGVAITTHQVTLEQARIDISAEFVNETYAASEWKAEAIIKDSKGTVLAEQGASGCLTVYAEGGCTWSLYVNDPQLWSPETPALYTAVISVSANGELEDTVEVPFGIRTVAFDADKGFLLNGQPYVIKGVCCHQDFAGVGVALPDSLIEHKLNLLKEMGCNAYRSAHHPATPHLLDYCDRIGMLVLDENRRLDSSEEGIDDLKELLYRGRNHPCIFMWSMENEEILEGTVMGTRILKTLTAITHQIDSTRPVTAAMNHGWNDGGYSDVVDVTGYNYGQRESQDVNDHLRYPKRCMIGSESASCTVTRSCYERDDVKGYCPEYGTHIPEWSCSVEKAWTDVMEHPFLSGVFVWTGFDYRGEPTPYAWPNINSHFGVMDTCGFPKDNYYYLLSQWREEPMVHIMPHWNWPGQEGCTKEVWVYTNCLEVELFLNGRSLGRKKCRPHGHLEWKVEYEPGSLSAVGYDSTGEVIVQGCQETTAAAASMKLIPAKQKLLADEEDTVCIEVLAVDKKGRVVPQNGPEVFFSVEGPGRILGVGNGDPSCHEADKADHRSFFAGKALVIIQATKETGAIAVTAKSRGPESMLEHADIELLVLKN